MENNQNTQTQKADIAKRTLDYSLSIIGLYRELEKDNIGRVLGKQLLRSGTSIGANVHEAQGAQTKPDFIAKMSIAYKEALETIYWLKLVKEAKLTSTDTVQYLLDEAGQLVKILSSILLTSKNNNLYSKLKF